MMSPGEYTLQVFRGRERTWIAQLFADSDASDETDLAGAAVLAAIAPHGGGSPTIALDCDVVSASEGIVSISISAEQSALLKGTFYAWSLTLIDSLGIPHPALTGTVLVQTDLTV